MKRIFNYLIAYIAWIIDMSLGVWIIYLARTDILGLFALRYKPGMWEYQQLVTFLDRAFVIILGLCWLAFMIFIEEYFRGGINKGNLIIRIAKLNGPVLLVIFCIDLGLFWLQGIGTENWLRWIILVCELGFGMLLMLYVRTVLPKKVN